MLGKDLEILGIGRMGGGEARRVSSLQHHRLPAVPYLRLMGQKGLILASDMDLRDGNSMAMNSCSWRRHTNTFPYHLLLKLVNRVPQLPNGWPPFRAKVIFTIYSGKCSCMASSENLYTFLNSKLSKSKRPQIRSPLHRTSVTSDIGHLSVKVREAKFSHFL